MGAEVVFTISTAELVGVAGPSSSTSAIVMDSMPLPSAVALVQVRACPPPPRVCGTCVLVWLCNMGGAWVFMAMAVKSYGRMRWW